MKRTPIRRKTPLRQVRRAGPDMEREEKPRAPATVATVLPLLRGVYGGSTSGVQVLKGPQAKPGKRAPTKDERAWMDAIVRFGCIACWSEGRRGVPAAVHHILRGGIRLGHKFTLPLCDPGHHQGGAQFGMVSRHPWKARFEAQYGDEWALLSTLQGVLKKRADGSYGLEREA